MGMMDECGIRKVNMLGELQDWQKLRQKTQKLNQYAKDKFPFVKKWLQRLDNILSNFELTYQGKIPKEFWVKIVDKDLFVPNNMSGGTDKHYINGWLKDFFLYDKDKNQLVDQEDIDIFRLPKSYIKVPVKVKYFDEAGNVLYEKDLKFLSGFTAALESDFNFRP